MTESSGTPRVVFVAQPTEERFGVLRQLVQEACQRVSADGGPHVVLRPLDDGLSIESIIDHFTLALHTADILIADITAANGNVFVEIGYAMGAGVPLVMVARDSALERPSLLGFWAHKLVYGSGNERSFVPQLVRVLQALLSEPAPQRRPWRSFHERSTNSMATVFISYCHSNREYLSRLQVHLKPPESAGLIELWDDSRIQPGQKWKGEIQQALSRAGVAILLISADFLASDFIVQNELPPLLRAAEQKGTTVLPLIVKHSRFLRDAHLSGFQAINDPSTPMISLSPADQEATYARLSERVEAIVKPPGA